MVTSATVRGGGGHAGWAGLGGWGIAWWGDFPEDPRGGPPTLHTAPPPSRNKLFLTFRFLCLLQSLRWDLPRPRRNHHHPPSTSTHTRAGIRLPTSSSSLESPGYPSNRPQSGKVIRFKKPALEREGGGGEGKRGPRKGRKGILPPLTLPTSRTHTSNPPTWFSQQTPAHPITKGGSIQNRG